MKTIVLDTNFILTCVKEKIDFIEDLQFRGFKLAVPKQVLDELGKLTQRKGAVKSRSEFALRLLKSYNLEVIDLASRYVDAGLAKLSKENKEVIIATIDLGLKRKIKGNKVVIRSKKKLEII